MAALDTNPHEAAGMLYETMRSQAKTVNYVQYQSENVPVVCLLTKAPPECSSSHRLATFSQRVVSVQNNPIQTSHDSGDSRI
jgi:hypothetical protein